MEQCMDKTNTCNRGVDLFSSNIVEKILSQGMGAFVNDDKRLIDMKYKANFLRR